MRIHQCWCLSLVAGLALGAAQAHASLVTVGSPLTQSFTPSGLGVPNAVTVTNVVLGEPGAMVASPVNGVVLRWRIAGATGGPFRLRILRPAGGIQFTGAGTGSPETPTSTATQTFATNLPIRAGDLIAVDTTNGSDQVGAVAMSGSNVGAWSPALTDGTSGPPAATKPDVEVALNADIQPAPEIASLSPASGSTAGGAHVVISGNDFDGTTVVKFGTNPAAVFPGGSDNQLTVVAPAGAAGQVPVTVTTIAGTSAPATFTYVQQPTITVGKFKRRKDGGVNLTVSVSGAGQLTARQTTAAASVRHKAPTLVRRARAAASKAGPVTLAIKPTAAALRLLKHHKSKRVRLNIVFAPTVGSPVRTQKTITLTRPSKKRH